MDLYLIATKIEGIIQDIDCVKSDLRDLQEEYFDTTYPKEVDDE